MGAAWYFIYTIANTGHMTIDLTSLHSSLSYHSSLALLRTSSLNYATRSSHYMPMRLLHTQLEEAALPAHTHRPGRYPCMGSLATPGNIKHQLSTNNSVEPQPNCQLLMSTNNSVQPSQLI